MQPIMQASPSPRTSQANERPDASSAMFLRKHSRLAEQLLSSSANWEWDRLKRELMAMEIVIASATEADAEAISALNREVQSVHATALPRLFKLPGPESFPPSAVRELLAKPENVVLLARFGCEPAGYVYAEIIGRPETSLRYAHALIYLHHISVAVVHRKRGVGRALVEAARQIGAQQGISTLALDVWSFNEPARRFFRRCGLTPYNERLWIE